MTARFASGYVIVGHFIADPSKVLLSYGKIWVDAQSRAKVGDGAIEVTEVEIGNAAIVVGVSVFRFETQGLIN